VDFIELGLDNDKSRAVVNNVIKLQVA
jgi:hypothetical protein